MSKLYRNMEFPWSHQVGDSSSSKGKNHKHQNLHLPPKKRFSIKSGLTAWRPDNRQQLILDNLWSSMSNHQKGEESINALVLHMEEQRNGEASMQQELSQKIDSLQTELSLQKAQTQAFLQNRLAEFDNFAEHFVEMQRENHALMKRLKKSEKSRGVLEKENEGFRKENRILCEERIEVIEFFESCLREKDALMIENEKLRQELESPSTPSINHSQESSSTPSIIQSQEHSGSVTGKIFSKKPIEVTLSGIFPQAGEILFLSKLPEDIVSMISEISLQDFTTTMISFFNKLLQFCDNSHKGIDGWFWNWERKNVFQNDFPQPCNQHDEDNAFERADILLMDGCRHVLDFSIPRISFYVFPLKDKFYNHHFSHCDLLKYGVLKSIIIRLEDEHRPEYQSLFGNNAWDIIRRSLHRSSSLFISIESSPPEWISSIRVQPAIHYIFISPVSSRSVLTPEAKFWPADGPIITQISKWRAWVQVNEWFWRKYPEHILQFSGNSQRVFQHLSLIDKPVQPGFSTRHNHWLDKFEEEYQLEAPTAYRRLYIP
ncbi:hypothetical protein CDL15_Pgr015731 [Punica granatum]|uniref:Uncharacterized protein n=1 Tax=Punica granatum TaxID=22663 RepID=A0A218XN58_PUNGR|nr:hypothetical protein CDL15_Pgr015731 [Punica granatum]